MPFEAPEAPEGPQPESEKEEGNLSDLADGLAKNIAESGLVPPDQIPDKPEEISPQNEAAKAMADALGMSDIAERLGEAESVMEAFSGFHNALQDAFATNPELAGELAAKITSRPHAATDEEANRALYDQLKKDLPNETELKQFLLGDLKIT